MEGVFANRTESRDFVVNEFERRGGLGCEVFIATAFFTEPGVVLRLLERGCRVRMVVRLGFPTSPSAIAAVLSKENLSLRIYTGRAFHPKLYIFGRETALVGSANLTHEAIHSNQEVVVSVAPQDERFEELAAIFQDYWDGAEVPTKQQLDRYAALYRAFERHHDAAEKLADEAARELGGTTPANIDRGRKKPSKSSLFLSQYRRVYQESVDAFGIVRRAYEATGFRKVSESKIPLRLEIDSFIDFVRDTDAKHDAWEAGPLRNEPEQVPIIQELVERWKVTYRDHFEREVVEENYPRLLKVFASKDSIMGADDGTLFDALCTLHSFHDRLRFAQGGLEGWRKLFPTLNPPKRTRESLAYLVHGPGDVVERMANMIYNSQYRLVKFGQANVQELVGWCNREELPVLNGRTTKVLRFFGSNVAQLD